MLERGCQVERFARCALRLRIAYDPRTYRRRESGPGADGRPDRSERASGHRLDENGRAESHILLLSIISFLPSKLTSANDFLINSKPILSQYLFYFCAFEPMLNKRFYK